MVAKMMSVLIVDDEDFIRELLREEMLELGIASAIEAACIEEAKVILENITDQTEQFDLIISDYSMPGGHGGTLLRYLYERNLSPYFVMFTSSSHLDLPATDQNFLGVIQKPNFHELVALIESKIPG